MANSKQLNTDMHTQTEIIFKEISCQKQIAKKFKISRHEVQNSL